MGNMYAALVQHAGSVHATCMFTSHKVQTVVKLFHLYKVVIAPGQIYIVPGQIYTAPQQIYIVPGQIYDLMSDKYTTQPIA